MGRAEEVVLLEWKSQQDRPDSLEGINLIFLSCILVMIVI